MTRTLWLLLITLFVLLPEFCLAGGNDNSLHPVDLFFESRSVIGVIEFTGRTSHLSISAKKYLDRISNSIKKAQNENKIIRFEGYVSTTLSNYEDVSLAMYRAKSVQDYLRNFHGISNPVFLNGQNDQTVKISTRERVEIAVYNDIFSTNIAPVSELITLE